MVNKAVNFGATWCVAFRTELPILDRLFEQRRKAGLQIPAVSEDRSDRETVARFVRSSKTGNLRVCRDPNDCVASSGRNNQKMAPFGLYGIPITYVITASGWVVGYIPGAVDWMSGSANEPASSIHWGSG
ncbi:TlpA disulfide reductase family protein [Bradyrhizobium genosp. P]|uniref:TlpA disulfide reductase family protein n=1 Tax=Bradyrhizobium genosp. P TaxID=83641 RepID=UPI003CEB1B05